jgi:hypothetical protein
VAWAAKSEPPVACGESFPAPPPEGEV